MISKNLVPKAFLKEAAETEDGAKLADFARACQTWCQVEHVGTIWAKFCVYVS